MIRIFQGHEWIGNFPMIEEGICLEFAAEIQAAGNHLITLIMDD